MRITYNPEADALYIALGEGPATGEGVALDGMQRGNLWALKS